VKITFLKELRAHLGVRWRLGVDVEIFPEDCLGQPGFEPDDFDRI
jgi:hypothetical protein